MDRGKKRYTNEQVSRIIRTALESKQTDTISNRDLVEIGKELGLAEDEVQEAVCKDEKLLEMQEKFQRKKVSFKYHLYSYLAVNALLLVINLITPGPWWFQWSVLGWGIGLMFHYKASHGVGMKKA